MKACTIELQRHKDNRGLLSVLEWPLGLPFTVHNLFTISEMTKGSIRGEHAHKVHQQLLFAACGDFEASVSDGLRWAHYRLTPSKPALYLPPLHWLKIENRGDTDGVLVVLSSHQYDESDYLRDYDEFLDAASKV